MRGESEESALTVASAGVGVAGAVPLAGAEARGVALPQLLALACTVPEGLLLCEADAQRELVPLLCSEAEALADAQLLTEAAADTEETALAAELELAAPLPLTSPLRDALECTDAETPVADPVSENVAVGGGVVDTETAMVPVAAALPAAEAVQQGEGEVVSAPTQDAVAPTLPVRRALTVAMLPVPLAEAQRVAKALREGEREVEGLPLFEVRGEGVEMVLKSAVGVKVAPPIGLPVPLAAVEAVADPVLKKEDVARPLSEGSGETEEEGLPNSELLPPGVPLPVPLRHRDAVALAVGTVDFVGALAVPLAEEAALAVGEGGGDWEGEGWVLSLRLLLAQGEEVKRAVGDA